MKEPMLISLAILGAVGVLAMWGGPPGQGDGGYRAAYAGQRSNCPPRRYRAVQSRADDDDAFEEDPRWQRVRPRQSSRPYPETDTRDAGITTAFRRRSE